MSGAERRELLRGQPACQSVRVREKRGDGVYLQRPSNCTITAAHDKSGVCRFVSMLCQRSLSTHTHTHSEWQTREDESG